MFQLLPVQCSHDFPPLAKDGSIQKCSSTVQTSSKADIRELCQQAHAEVPSWSSFSLLILNLSLTWKFCKHHLGMPHGLRSKTPQEGLLSLPVLLK